VKGVGVQLERGKDAILYKVVREGLIEKVKVE
jgi:hypothetical protein